MTNALPLHNRSESDKHQDNMLASLNRRLDVARASHNLNLVALLEREKQQATPIAPSSVARSGRNVWQATAQFLTQWLFGGSALQVAEIVDGSDRWWVASDPRTGQQVYADSEAELRLWIEENYQGR